MEARVPMKGGAGEVEVKAWKWCWCLVAKASQEVPARGTGGCVVGRAWISLPSLMHALVASAVDPAATARCPQPLDGCNWLVVMRTGTFSELSSAIEAHCLVRQGIFKTL